MMTELIHGYLATTKKKQLWWIIKDIWVLLFGFVEAGDIGRDGKMKTDGYYLFLKGSEYNTG